MLRGSVRLVRLRSLPTASIFARLPNNGCAVVLRRIASSGFVDQGEVLVLFGSLKAVAENMQHSRIRKTERRQPNAPARIDR